ncbi:MAG: hypothetical protein EKK71_15440 [Candidatus Competibacteraceae bacterium]|nr:MAG: hypothetical protein EKK71_15440 [Candidatus Competibacteraceae bacterium]
MPDRATVQSRLQLWVKQGKASGLHGFDTFLNTLYHWQEGILNSFDGRQTSGFVEGFNKHSSCSNAAALAWMAPPNCCAGCGWISRVHAFGHQPLHCILG